MNRQSEKIKSKMAYVLIAIAGLTVGTGLALLLPHEQGHDHSGPGSNTLTTPRFAKSVPTVSAGRSGDVPQEETSIAQQPEQIGANSVEYRDPIEDVRAVYAERSSLNIASPASYYPRPESEWQGMLVDTAHQSYCDGKASSCGLAMACTDNRCGPCLEDSDCGLGESCVLDHCIVSEQMECRSSADCGPGSLCVLSGYSADPRGNADTRSYCQTAFAGTSPSPDMDIDPVAEDPGPPVLERPVSVDRLRESLIESQDLAEADQIPMEPVSQDPVPGEAFDELAEEHQFEKHDLIDVQDPQDEHVIVENELEEPEEELSEVR